MGMSAGGKHWHHTVFDERAPAYICCSASHRHVPDLFPKQQQHSACHHANHVQGGEIGNAFLFSFLRYMSQPET